MPIDCCPNYNEASISARMSEPETSKKKPEGWESEFSPAATSDDSAETTPMLFCPVCSTRLVSRRCKLLCERCGYYMSCADYY